MIYGSYRHQTPKTLTSVTCVPLFLYTLHCRLHGDGLREWKVGWSETDAGNWDVLYARGGGWCNMSLIERGEAGIWCSPTLFLCIHRRTPALTLTLRVFGGVGRGLFHRAAVALSLSTDNGYIKDYRLKIISTLLEQESAWMSGCFLASVQNNGSNAAQENKLNSDVGLGTISSVKQIIQWRMERSCVIVISLSEFFLSSSLIVC